MAESVIAVTEGAGKKIHTWSRTIGANTVEDEYQIIGDQPLATYVIDTSGTSIATANDHPLQIMAGGSLNVYLRRLRAWQLALATTAAIVQFSLFRLTTAGTGGTASGLDPLDSSDAGANGTAMTLPTAKGTEGARLYNWTAGLIQTVSTAGEPTLLFDLDFDKNPRLKIPRIPAGTTNGLALKNVTGHAAATILIAAEVTEANY